MDLYTTIALGIFLSVVMHYLNDRFFNIQGTIAITLGALTLSLLIIISHNLGWSIFQFSDLSVKVVREIDFESFFINGILGLLLFAGAFTVEFDAILENKWEIGTLAFIGTIASTLIIATATYYLLQAFNMPQPFILCAIFGALISPTDPIAVLATLKEIKAPKSLTAKIAGESLFNDGIGLVIFVSLYELAFTSHNVTTSSVIKLFLQESIGGVLYGIALGFGACWLIKRTKDPKLEVLTSIAIATAGYVFAQQVLDISGPLAMVSAGLTLAHYGKTSFSRNGMTQMHLFWEITEELFNAILFLLIGLEIVTFQISLNYITIGLITIPLVLATRLLTVACPMAFFKQKKRYTPLVITILTWGGLRGGLALAMALSIPQNAPMRDLCLIMTYCVVLFSIVVQGLTAKPLVARSKALAQKT